MKTALLAAVVSMFVALGLHAYDCHAGTHEMCLISRGMLWAYWIAAFVFVGLPVALVVRAVLGSKPARKDDAD
jgi:hypothetical protein